MQVHASQQLPFELKNIYILIGHFIPGLPESFALSSDTHIPHGQ